MARSSYIYLVQDPETLRPKASFTVKHELESYLDKTTRQVVVTRLRDGAPVQHHWQKFQAITQLDPETLKPLDD